MLEIFIAYRVLAMQYNSVVHPVVVLLALPFSFIGAFGVMAITNASLNNYSMISTGGFYQSSARDGPASEGSLA